ncbi:MAG: RNA-binding protein [Calditrichota bacterium]
MRIYVGNLSFKTTEAHLSEAFGRFGTVETTAIIVDKVTNRSRGFGFVEMTNDDEATAAIAAMDGAMFMERTLKVNEAKPRTDRPPRREGGPGRR